MQYWHRLWCLANNVSSSYEFKLKMLLLADDAIRKADVSLLRSSITMLDEDGFKVVHSSDMVLDFAKKSGIEAFVMKTIAEVSDAMI